MIDGWTFGGGTALMLQIHHHESFDVDIFLDDPQLLPYLNPKTQGYALDINPDGYESDGSRTLKIVFENVGEIDLCPQPAGNPAVRAEVRGRQVLLETPGEIIARRFTPRRRDAAPRHVRHRLRHENSRHGIPRLGLKAFQDKCEAALKVARQMNPQFAETIMTRLLYRETLVLHDPAPVQLPLRTFIPCSHVGHSERPSRTKVE